MLFRFALMFAYCAAALNAMVIPPSNLAHDISATGISVFKRMDLAAIRPAELETTARTIAEPLTPPHFIPLAPQSAARARIAHEQRTLDQYLQMQATLKRNIRTATRNARGRYSDAAAAQGRSFDEAWSGTLKLAEMRLKALDRRIREVTAETEQRIQRLRDSMLTLA